MKKFCALLITVLVVLQAFFVSVFADGEDQNTVFVQKSLSETTLQEDLLGDASGTDDDVEDFVSVGESGYDRFEVLSAAYECDYFTYSFYLYVKNDDIDNIGSAGSILYPLQDFDIMLKRPDLPSWNPFNPPYQDPSLQFPHDLDPTQLPKYNFANFSATVVDNTKHVAKIRLDLPSTSPYILHLPSGGVGIDISRISYRSWHSSPVWESFEGGYIDSSLRIEFSQYTATAPVRGSSSSQMRSHFATNYVSSEPVLHLDVCMMSDRFSSSRTDTWSQLNTAAFLIPNKYVDKYGDYLYVHYTYGVYNDVPMIVYPSSYNYTSLFSTPGFNLIHLYNTSGWLQLDYLDFCPYFAFEVDSVNHSSDGEFDVSTPDLLFAWNTLKGNESPSNYQSVLKCSSYESHDVWKGPKDSFETESLVDAYGWWSWLFAGAFPWDTVVDDSINVSATELVTSNFDLLTLRAASDENVSSNFYVCEQDASQLRSLANAALLSDSSVAIVRYCMTDYHIYENEIPNGYINDADGIEFVGNDAYIARNAIISGFQILQIGLSAEPYDTSDIQSLILSGDIHVIDVDMDPVDYIGPVQPDQSLIDGIVVRYDPWKWLKRIIAILVVFAILVAIYYVLKFIGAFRSAFSRRRGDPPPEKKQRKRLFRRRKE